jgi:hypothetical protein
MFARALDKAGAVCHSAEVTGFQILRALCLNEWPPSKVTVIMAKSREYSRDFAIMTVTLLG